jgi:hypothetical protein
MIDPATGWFEIAQEYDDKRSISIASIVEQQWFAQYPLPAQIIFDRGSKFMGHEFIEMVFRTLGAKNDGTGFQSLPYAVCNGYWC